MTNTDLPPTAPAPPDFLPAPFEWVEISAGPFLMGSDPAQDAAAYEDEQPQLTVDLPAYHIARYPVTVAQYAVFVDDGGYQNDAFWTESGVDWRGDKVQPLKYWQDERWHIADHPVIGVSWFEACAFSQWLGARTGLPVRLPTEPEWEKAARGTDGRIYPWGDQEPDETLCNFDGNVGKTSPVTQYPAGASPYGVLDLAGNVWEWSVSRFGWQYAAGIDALNNDPEGLFYRVMCGGGWGDPAVGVRPAYRHGAVPNDWDFGRGFRVVVGPR